MTSGTSRKLKVTTDLTTASETFRKLWVGLPYQEKKIKIDRLPIDFWGTFKVEGPGTPKKKFNKVHFFSEIKQKDEDNVVIKIEAVLPDPIFGQGALTIVARCIFLLAKHFRRRNIEVASVWQVFGPNLIL